VDRFHRQRREPETSEHVGSAFDWWIERHGLTLEDVAKAVGCHHSTILRIRHGRTLPSWPLAEKIVDFMTDHACILYRIEDVFPVRLLRPTRRNVREAVL